MSSWRAAARLCERVPDGIELGQCAYCGADLPRRKDGGVHRGRTSCGAECAKAFGINHDWSMARAAAVERDGGKCVTCGIGPGLSPERVGRPSRVYDRAYGFPRTDRPVYRDAWTWLPEHGPLEAYDAAFEEHYRRNRLEVKAYDERCREFESTHRQLEVNHIEPRVGAGYGVGCWNHLDNLETLCHPCHVEVTTAQRRARKHAEHRQRVVEFGGEELALEWEAARRKLGLVPGDDGPSADEVRQGQLW